MKEYLEIDNRRAFSFLEDMRRVSYVNARVDSITVECPYAGAEPSISVKFSTGDRLAVPLCEMSDFAAVFAPNRGTAEGRWSSSEFIGQFVRLCYTRDLAKFDSEKYSEADEEHRRYNVFWKAIADGGMFELSDHIEFGNLVAVKFIIDECDCDTKYGEFQNRNTYMCGSCLLEGERVVRKRKRGNGRSKR